MAKAENVTVIDKAHVAATEMVVPIDELTQAVRKYSAEKQRVPTSLNEVVAAGYMKNIPAAPPGKRFAINPKRVEVILINQ